MSKIKVLSEEIRNLIAAGEVVERPISVVKELIENSIDAGAAEIRLEIKSGGIESIVVSDNGEGMTKEDLRLSIESHATSKLAYADDLQQIKTLGFRGEALPSIASVSKMDIITKSASSTDPAGYKMSVEGGKMISLHESGAQRGTIVTVNDLFFNVPARKKFMRTARTEMGHIKDLLERMAIANPDIRFQLLSDGREIINAFTKNDYINRSKEIVGSDIIDKCYQISADAGDYRLYGLIGDPSVAKKKTSGMYWFVNGRTVKDRLLNHALIEAFRSLLPKGYVPFSILYLNVPNNMIDVNVHPTKSEIRFLESGSIHQFIINSVRQGIYSSKKEMDSGRNDQSEPIRNEKRYNLKSEKEFKESIREKIDRIKAMNRKKDEAGGNLGAEDYETEGRKEFSPINLSLESGNFSKLKPIGQLGKTYLLCEKDDGALVVIDQHAAHERIGYEKLKHEFSRSVIKSQRLLLPEVVRVDAKNVGYLEESLNDMNKLGWEIEFFGGDSFCVKAIPALLRDVNISELINSISEDLSEYSSQVSFNEKIDSILKVTACHAQIRAGDKLSLPEIDYLLREMDKIRWSGRCPHGRPAVREFDPSEIEKWFLRS